MYFNTQQSNIESVQLLNSEGIIFDDYPSNPQDKEDVGQNLSSFQGVSSVLNDHSGTIGQVYFDTSGKPMICILEPVFYEGKFKGLIQSKISLNKMYKKFVQPIKAGQQGICICKK